MIWILLLIAVIGFAIYVAVNFKTPKIGSMVCVTGGVKSGKSTFSLHLAYSAYKRNLNSVKFRNFFARLLNKEEEELPLFYTTVPVAVPHVLLTKDLLQRKTRFAYKSVIWVDEASILADSMTYKDLDLNDQLLLFNKLIAHETHGGTIVFNSQSVSDLHYSIKRCLSEVFYVHDTCKWIPFFLVATVREERYSEDNSTVSTYDEDIEDSLKKVLMPKSIWSLFDCYCYSSMTDNLPIEDNVVVAESLKARKIIAFNPRHAGEINDKGDFIKDNEKENC